MFASFTIAVGIVLFLIGDIFREGFYPHAGNFFMICGVILTALGMVDKMIDKMRNKK
jgi:hypothetical membrane protein